MPVEIVMPKLGLNMTEGKLVEWLHKEGDVVHKGEPLFVVETEKVTIEAEAPADGVLGRILVLAGETVPVGHVVALLVQAGEPPLQEDVAGVRAPPAAEEKTNRVASEAPRGRADRQRFIASPKARRLAREHGVDLKNLSLQVGGRRISAEDVELEIAQRRREKLIKASPVARRLASERGVDLAQVKGTGVDGRITRSDVERYLERSRPEEGRKGEIPYQELPLEGPRAVIARRMHASLHTMAQFTLHAMVDATALVEFRARLKVQAEDGTAPSLDAILARLTAQALREHPQLNARLVGQKIHLLQEIHIGIAVDTPAGLLVVVVRDADAKSLAEIDGELRSLVERARNGKARPDEVSGSTFTISNMGHLGIDAFTPIINPPEAALLGVGRIREELVVHEGKVAQRHRMTLSLTVDHRIVDGAPAARFLQHLAQLINEVG